MGLQPILFDSSKQSRAYLTWNLIYREHCLQHPRWILPNRRKYWHLLRHQQSQDPYVDSLCLLKLFCVIPLQYDVIHSNWARLSPLFFQLSSCQLPFGGLSLRHTILINWLRFLEFWQATVRKTFLWFKGHLEQESQAPLLDSWVLSCQAKLPCQNSDRWGAWYTQRTQPPRLEIAYWCVWQQIKVCHDYWCILFPSFACGNKSRCVLINDVTLPLFSCW